MLDYNKKA